jgi:predicted RNA-binding protein
MKKHHVHTNRLVRNAETLYNRADAPIVLEKWNMCEFTVFLDGKAAFKDVVFAKMESNKVVVKDVLGQSKEFKNCKITEVDVNSTRLVLSSV